MKNDMIACIVANFQIVDIIGFHLKEGKGSLQVCL